METLLIRERYKVVRVLAIEPGYALVEAVDISDRETPTCLLNLYEGAFLHRYARICTGIRKEDCPAFRGMFLERGTLVAAFDRSEGEEIDRLFYRGDKWSWRDRLYYADLVLHKVLSMANLPPEVSCAALLSENLLIDLNHKRLDLRWKLRPMADMNPREVVLMAADQVRKILPRSIMSGPEEVRFLDLLEQGAFRNAVTLYGQWRESEKAIREEREAFEQKNFIQKAFILLGRAIRRKKGRGGM